MALTLAWLASQVSYVHRIRLVPSEPVYTSNYLEARGFLFPWLIVEVPAGLGSVPLSTRLDLKNAAILVLIAAIVAACVTWVLTLAAGIWRRMFAT